VDITLELATAPTDDVRALVGQLEDDLAAGYPPEQRHGLAIDAIFQPHIRFFVARADGAAVGCAGVALFDGFAELKRMYVRATYRGRGIAEVLLARIEAVTRDAGIERLCLETGTVQHAAMRFYARVGFSVCGPFGAYVAMPAANIQASVFFDKHLASATVD
jgi:putative acetyltransferase